MIEGIRVVLSSEELKTHLIARAAHHAEKGTWYANKAMEIERDAPATAVNNDPARQLKSSAEDHIWKSRYFEFLAAHIQDGESYRLGEGDLENLEFMSRRYIQ